MHFDGIDFHCIPAKSENNKVDTDNRDVGEANTRFGE
jgi:hypothetical protein